MPDPEEPQPGREGVDGAATAEAVVRFYTRPACGFSVALRRQLADIGLPLVEYDIWDDPEAAAFVRSVARGHETVPTVALGEHALVNPTPRDVVRLVQAVAPHLLPDEPEPTPPGRLRRFFSATD